MAGFIYTAKKSLVLGHVAAEVYGVDIRMLSAEHDNVRNIVQQESVGGAVETLFYNRKRTWQFASRQVALIDLAVIQEFLDSTEAGESFTFDPYGTTLAPHQPRIGIRADEGYSPKRALRQGNGGQNDLFTVSFSVREL